MYSKSEKQELVQRFWSQFDIYCNSLPELAIRKKKWILHDTKIGHLDLKFDVGRDFAMVALEINHRNDEFRFKFFEILERYKPMLEKDFEDGLIWDFCFVRQNEQEVCRIYQILKDVDFHKITDWLAIYTFFAENMLKLQYNFLEIQEYLQDEVAYLRNQSKWEVINIVD